MGWESEPWRKSEGPETQKGKTNMRAEEYHAMVARSMTEKQLQDAVIGFATRAGWLVYHTHDSRRSQPGFPDLVLVHPDHGTLFRELKTMAGKVSPAQGKWLDTLTAAGQDANVWRPVDWMGSRIRTELGVS
jgi:hypothetical protein